jgi:hypothetical protein
VAAPFSVEDYYGVKVAVQPVMKSSGPFVYLEVEIPSCDGEELERQDFYRFPAEDALKLAEAITKAAKERF